MTFEEIVAKTSQRMKGMSEEDMVRIATEHFEKVVLTTSYLIDHGAENADDMLDVVVALRKMLAPYWKKQGIE